MGCVRSYKEFHFDLFIELVAIGLMVTSILCPRKIGGVLLYVSDLLSSVDEGDKLKRKKNKYIHADMNYANKLTRISRLKDIYLDLSANNDV